MKAVILPKAQDDILRQFRWYLVEQDAADATFRFVESVEASVERLLRMPGMGAPREIKKPALKGLRFWPVKVVTKTSSTEIVAVLRVSSLRAGFPYPPL